ncbi:MAG: carbohydrate ABC transporter permease [Bdellovibrionota bacterium]
MRRSLVESIGLWFAVIVVSVFSLFPFYWAVVSSLKEPSSMFQVEYWPKVLEWSNYSSIFKEQPFGTNIINSLIVASSTVLLCLIVGVLAAYSLARVEFRGRGTLLALILAVSMFPQVAVLSGMFELIKSMGLYNSWGGLTISYMIFTLPFTIWLLTTFMRQLPRELEQAAIVDGASSWVVLTKVFLPLMGPSLVTTGLLAFIAAWNEFLFALTFTLTAESRTVPVAIGLISGASSFESPWGRIMAASVIVTVPLVILVLVFQKSIVSGLTAGAIKE